MRKLPGTSLVGNLVSAVVERVDPDRYRGRRVWCRDTRAHIGLRATHRPTDELAAALERHPAVNWAVVNAVLGVVVVDCTQPPPIDDLIDLLDDVEWDAPTDGRSVAPAHPALDGALARASAAALADLAGLSLAGLGRLLRVTPLPLELASLVTVVDSQPRLREAVERALGRDRTELGLALTHALAQALAQGSTGLAIDLAARGLQVAEQRARRATWERVEPELAGTPDRARAEPVPRERPVPPPVGPVERYAEQLGLLAGAAFAGGLLLSRSPRRASVAAVSVLPKAAGLGREAFASHLGRELARRGVVVVEPAVLRRLDRLDVAVLDAETMLTGRLVVGAVLPLQGGDPSELTAAAHRLFDPDRWSAPQHGDGLTLAPLEANEAERADQLPAGAAHLLGLRRDGGLVAVAQVLDERLEGATALMAAARRAGLRVVLAGVPGVPGAELADRVVPGGSRLVGSVHELQAAGAAVLLVSRQGAALAAADCGLGVAGTTGRPAWGGHLLVGTDYAAAALVVEAAGVARDVSRRGVTLARMGTVVGSATALSGRLPGLAGRTLLAVNGAGAVSLANGVWAASALVRRPLVPPALDTPWHAMPAESVLERLGTSRDGLSADEVRRRRRAEPALRPVTPSLGRAFLSELDNPLTPVLAGSAALSGAIGALTDAAIVTTLGTVSALTGAVQRFSTDRAVAKLLEHTAIGARVLRDGAERDVSAQDLVPGDVVLLRSGDVVPADCRLLAGGHLEVDESSLTGESMPVRKNQQPTAAAEVAERTSMVFEGTTVASGEAIAVVVAVREGTQAGRSHSAGPRAASMSGVDRRLAQLTRVTVPIAAGSAGVVVLLGWLRGRPVQRTIGSAVALAVAAVPEGLPFLVSAAQLAAARRLSAAQALVRNPRAIETLGRVDVLCFDKTGTLTEGRIALRSVTDGQGESAVESLGPAAREVLAAALRATPEAAEDRPPEHPTDRAVLRGAAQAGVANPGWRPIAVLPFEPSRGYHATLAESAAGRLLSVKGAPEVVIPRCATRNRQPVDHHRLGREVDRLAGRGFRLLAVAERPADGAAATLADGDVVGLDFRGFLVFADPVRGAAGASVRDLRDAGVQVIMITGDHPSTAEAIAAELDLNGVGRVVTGAELDELDEAQLDRLLPQVSVVARGTPAHKVRVVQSFQRLGRTVAMTGDGANDAPAIRLADVGIALGRRGTPAARAAADVVVADDRLETILAALVEGRAMWKSVRQALGILLGGNLGEIAFTLLGSALTGDSLLNARQLLLVNLFTDLVPALAVALRPPSRESAAGLLAEGPEASLGGLLTREIAVRAVATAGGAGSAWAVARLTGRAPRARTVALVALVGTQLGQTVLIGWRSPAVLAASAGSAAALAVVVQTPGVSQFFGCTPVGPVGWTIAGCASVGATAGSLLLPSAWEVLRPRLPAELAVPFAGRYRLPAAALPGRPGAGRIGGMGVVGRLRGPDQRAGTASTAAATP